MTKFVLVCNAIKNDGIIGCGECDNNDRFSDSGQCGKMACLMVVLNVVKMTVVGVVVIVLK